MPTCPSDKKLSNLVCPGELHGTAVDACQSLHVSVLKSNLLDWLARWSFFSSSAITKMYTREGGQYNVNS